MRLALCRRYRVRWRLLLVATLLLATGYLLTFLSTQDGTALVVSVIRGTSLADNVPAAKDAGVPVTGPRIIIPDTNTAVTLTAEVLANAPCPRKWARDPASKLCRCAVNESDPQRACTEPVLPLCALDIGDWPCDNARALATPMTTCDCLHQCLLFLESFTPFHLTRSSPFETHCLVQLTNTTSPSIRLWDYVQPNASLSLRAVRMPLGELSIRFDVVKTTPELAAHAPLPLPWPCPENCSRHGVCTANGCVCLHRWRDSNCANRVDHIPCLSNCNNRGLCFQGACACNPPYSGIDCGLTNPQPPNPNNCIKGTGCVFILDLWGPHAVPWQFLTYNGWYLDFSRGTPAFFLQQALQSPRRVFTPEAADLFLIPTSGPAWDSRLNVLGVLRTTYAALWDRCGGCDFFWLPMVDDVGSSPYWGKPSALWPASLALAAPEHSARLVCMGLLDGATVNGIGGSFVRGRDLVIPPLPKVEFQIASFRPTGKRQARVGDIDPRPKNFLEERHTRPLLLFFSGKIDHIWPVKSGNVRLAAQQAADEWAHPRVAIVEGYVPDDAATMENSTFCLAPPGIRGGWGFRSSMAVLSGCVPVYVQDHRALELEELWGKDFSRVAVVMREADMPSKLLPLLLHLEASGEARRMRDEMLTRAFEVFAWRGTALFGNVTQVLWQVAQKKLAQ